MRILLVEDHESFAATIAVRLGRDGQCVDIETDGNRAAALLSHKDFDLVLLDVNPHGRSGFEILRELRLAGDDIPLRVLTANSEIDERIPGLDTGADDFDVKAVDRGEPAARWPSARPTGWPWSCCCCHGARGDRAVAAACPGAARGARGAADRADPLDPRLPLRAAAGGASDHRTGGVHPAATVHAFVIGNIVDTFISPVSPAMWLALGLARAEIVRRIRYSHSYIWVYPMILMAAGHLLAALIMGIGGGGLLAIFGAPPPP
ncbi:response regulator transcription factor, partial [Salipiger sp. HF18]|uniref:response regulator transcription factor n=1 Tax=Salipiger sp. HF18 TaxID=2721557 RepID=UPI001C37D512